MLKRLSDLFEKLFDDFFADEIMTRSAALAFYASLAMAPIVVLTIIVLSVMGVNLQDEFVREVRILVGGEAAQLLQTIIAAANDRPDLKSISGWIGGAGLLISASFIFVQLQDTLNMIFNVRRPDTKSMRWRQVVKLFFLNRLISIGMMLIFIFFFIVSVVISTVISFLYSNESGFFVQAINFLLSLAVFTALFALIYKWVPDRKISFESAMTGGAITAFLFLMGKAFIGLYLAQSAVGSAYGAAGSLLVTLVWIYYSSLVVFFGAEISFLTLKNRENVT